MTWLEIVKEEAAKASLPIPDDETADFILWEETGFPEFWPSGHASPEAACRFQLMEFFSGVRV